MTVRSVRPQKPRTRTFRYAEDSRPSNRVPKDDRTLNPGGAQIELVRPKWNGNGPLTFRPFPMFCAEDPDSFDPTRLSLNQYDFSDFWRGYPAAKYVGIETKFTFITYDPRWPRENAYNPRTDNPFHVLYNALADASKTGKAVCAGKNLMTTEWVPLISANNQEKAISAPTKLYFMQGAVFENDGEIFGGGSKPPRGLGEEDLPQIIELAKTAGDDIAARLNELNPSYNGDTLVEKQGEMFRVGDIVDLKAGSFITVYNPDKHRDVDEEQSEKAGGREFKSWSIAIKPEFCFISKRQPVTVAADLTKWLSVIRDRLVWWDDLIYVPKTEEICVWLAQAFVQMPDMLRYAWTDNPEFFTDDVNGILANRGAISGAAPAEEAEEIVATETKKAPAGMSKTVAAAFEEEPFDDDDGDDDEAEEILRRAEQRMRQAAAPTETEPQPEVEAEKPKKVVRKKKIVKVRKTKD